MEAELRGSFSDCTVELVAGSGGVFDVAADGLLIFSKKKLGRFPEDGEISELLMENDGKRNTGTGIDRMGR